MLILLRNAHLHLYSQNLAVYVTVALANPLNPFSAINMLVLV